MKKVVSNYFGLILIVLLIVAKAVFDLPDRYTYLLASLIILSLELINWRKFSLTSEKGHQIKVKSLSWISSILFTGMLIYWFTKEGLSPIIWLAIGFLLVYQLMFAIRNRHNTYIFGAESFYGLNDSIQISYNSIRNIDIDDDLISIHTRDHKHEFDLDREKLVSPTWENARDLFKALQI